MTLPTSFHRVVAARAAVLTSIALMGLTVGCERSEKIVEVQTPAGGMEVKKTTTTSIPTGVDLKPTQETKIEVETTRKVD